MFSVATSLDTIDLVPLRACASFSQLQFVSPGIIASPGKITVCAVLRRFRGSPLFAVAIIRP
jgi:hypothetical protein